MAAESLTIDNLALFRDSIGESPEPRKIQQEHRAPRSLSWRPLALLATVCLAAALAGRLSYLAEPFRNDSGLFVYMGKLVAEGGRFGADLSDNKFPTVGLLLSVFWRLFGSNWTAYVLLQTTMGLTGAVLLGRSAALYVGKYAGWPTALYTLVYFNLHPVVFTGFQLETLHGFFAILGAGAALVALTDGDLLSAFAVGLAAGCAGMAKPGGLAVAGAFALAIFFNSRTPRQKVIQLSGATAGVLLVAAVAFIYLLASNTLGFLPGIYHEISAYASKTPLDAWELSRPALALIGGGFPFLVRGWLARRDRISFRPRSNIIAFAYFWLILEIGGVVMQRRLYPYHFLVLAPPAGLLFGLIPRRLRVGSLAAALAPMVLLSIVSSAPLFSHINRRADRLPISDYIVAHTTPGDSIWEDNMGRLLIETGLKPGARYPLTFVFCNDDQAPIRLGAVILSDFEQRKPIYIALTTNLHEDLESRCRIIASLIDSPIRRDNYLQAWRQIENYVHEHYTAETRIGGETLYRRWIDLPRTP